MPDPSVADSDAPASPLPPPPADHAGCVSRAEHQSALDNWAAVAGGLRDIGDRCAAERDAALVDLGSEQMERSDAESQLDAALAEVERLREALAEAVRFDSTIGDP